MHIAHSHEAIRESLRHVLVDAADATLGERGALAALDEDLHELVTRLHRHLLHLNGALAAVLAAVRAWGRHPGRSDLFPILCFVGEARAALEAEARTHHELRAS